MPPSEIAGAEPAGGGLKRLEAEYNMFCRAGCRDRVETRSRVQAMVKKCDRRRIDNTGERYRFATFRRGLRRSPSCGTAVRAREEGRAGPFAQTPAPGGTVKRRGLTGWAWGMSGLRSPEPELGWVSPKLGRGFGEAGRSKASGFGGGVRFRDVTGLRALRAINDFESTAWPSSSERNPSPWIAE